MVIHNLFLKDLTKGKNYLLSLFVAFLASCTIALLWEVFEFCSDTLFSGNAQRFIPEIEGIYNGGDSSLNLEGSMEDIYNFYVKPEGYRYALLDTMKDMILCLVSTILTSMALGIYCHFKSDVVFDYLICKENKLTN